MRAMSAFICIAFCGTAMAQTQSENGAVTVSIDGGTSFGLPAVQTGVSVGSQSVLSPDKRTLGSLGFTASVRAWKFLVPYFDFDWVDTGKATAQIGTVTSMAQANTFLLTGGVRVIPAHGRLRPYVQFGGGTLHQSVTSTLNGTGTQMNFNGSGSIGAISYGGGIQYLAHRHWGGFVEFDAFHFTKPFLSTGGQNSSTIRAGLLFQTRTRLE